MNKRIICLLLSVIMLLLCFAGCGKKTDEEIAEDITNEASESAMTLSMYLLADAPVSAEQAAKIEAAVNKITKSKFKTQMKLTFLTEDQYYTVLEENLRLQEENSKNYTSNKYTDETTEAETVWNEQLGAVELKYPTIESYQVDIFYFDSYDRFVKYNEAGYLSKLDEELSSSSKALKSYITPSYLTYMKAAANGTYAIPTNKPIGEYTYMLLNKEALALTHNAPSDGFTSVTSESVQDLLEMVSENWSDKFVPLYSEVPTEDMITGVKYWGVDENGKLSNEFSVLGGDINSKAYKTEGAFTPVENILDSSFVDQLKILKGYEVAKYYDDKAVTEQNKDFAVGYVKGGPELEQVWGEKYEMVVVEKPTLDTYDLFNDMFGVSTYSSNLARSMKIVTYLNTNEDFRNLILHGIEGENYELVKSGIKDINGEEYVSVRRLNNDYIMDENKTGNVLLALATEDQRAERLEYSKKQNSDATVTQSIAFLPNYNGLEPDMDKLHAVRTLSEKIFKELMECPLDQLDELVTAKKTEINADENVIFTMDKSISNEDAEGEERPCSFSYVLYSWLEANKIYVPPKDDGADA